MAGPPDGTRPSALAVDASHGREFSVAACWLDGEDAHAEEVWAGTDDGALLEWLVARAGRRVPVVVDGMSPAASLVPDLKAQRVDVRVTSAGDMAKACGLFVGEVEARRLSHADQPALADALEAARKRAIGTAGGWGWNRKDDQTNIAPLVALTLARYGAAVTSKARSASFAF